MDSCNNRNCYDCEVVILNGLKVSLKAARVNAGLTQENAAEKLHVTVTTIRNWEKGKSYPDVPQIKNIENVYGVEYKDIIFSEH